jgi:hypothetical protein
MVVYRSDINCGSAYHQVIKCDNYPHAKNKYLSVVLFFAEFAVDEEKLVFLD